MKLCKECEHFKVICQPMEHYEPGQAECKKHNLIVDFFNERKLNRLSCVEKNVNGSEWDCN